MRIAIGQSLGRYRIEEEIGAGGMGVVYRAYDQKLERDLAIKVLSPGTLDNEVARKRFRNEARVLSRLNHPSIQTIHDFDTADGTDFLVSELVPGQSLDARLTSGPLPEKEVIRMGVQLAQGLAAAHAAGILHRDLKPANLRVTPDGRTHVLWVTKYVNRRRLPNLPLEPQLDYFESLPVGRTSFKTSFAPWSPMLA